MPVMTKSPNGDDIVILSRAEYDQLVSLKEDRADAAILRRARAERKAGKSETLTSKDIDELLAAKTPLAFWRKRRAMSQTALSQHTGISQGFLSEIEAGLKTGDIGTLVEIAKALAVSVDDLVVEPAVRTLRKKASAR
jgi:DNA-binding Xre family transcriptional regulator